MLGQVTDKTSYLALHCVEDSDPSDGFDEALHRNRRKSLVAKADGVLAMDNLATRIFAFFGSSVFWVQSPAHSRFQSGRNRDVPSVELWEKGGCGAEKVGEISPWGKAARFCGVP